MLLQCQGFTADQIRLYYSGADLRYALLKDTAFARRRGPGRPVTLRLVANVSNEAACNQLCLQERQPGAAAADSINTTVRPTPRPPPSSALVAPHPLPRRPQGMLIPVVLLC